MEIGKSKKENSNLKVLTQNKNKQKEELIKILTIPV